MPLTPIEKNRRLLLSVFRFKQHSKLYIYIIKKGATQKTFYTLVEILNILRISIRTEGLHDVNHPSTILCCDDLENVLDTKSLQAKDLRGKVLEHLIKINSSSSKHKKNCRGG